MRIFFLHNPKAGGTSLRALLAEGFHEHEISPVFNNSPYQHRCSRDSVRSINGFKFYAGHYGYDTYKILGHNHSLVTNFRDPVNRIRSLYRYWRAICTKGIDPKEVNSVHLAKELSFSDFLRTKDMDTRLYIDNFHFRQILHSGWELSRMGYAAQISVMARIKRMPWFYIAEMPGVSIKLLQSTFPEYNSTKLPFLNGSAGNYFDIDADDAAYLVQRNQLDYKIYAYAMKLQVNRARSLL